MIAVRLLGQRAVVRESVYREAPVRIGRGADNEFVILDPSVSRLHARLQRGDDGGWWLEDLSSCNGITAGGARVDKAAVPREGSLRCRLGSVEVEIACDSTSDTLELRREELLAVREKTVSPWAGFAYWLTAVLAWIGVWASRPPFWSPWKTDRSTELSWVALGVSALVPVTAFLCLGLLRIAGRRVRLTETLRVLALFSGARLVLGLALLAAFYAFAPGAVQTLTSVVGAANVILFTSYLASLGRSRGRRRFFLAWTAALVLLAVGVAVAGRQARRQSGTPATDYTVMVPLLGTAGPATTVDSYFETLRADFGKAEAAAAEEFRRMKARGR